MIREEESRGGLSSTDFKNGYLEEYKRYESYLYRYLLTKTLLTISSINILKRRQNGGVEARMAECRA